MIAMKKEHILILEINGNDYNLLKKQFQEKGYETTPVLDKEKFLQLVKSTEEEESFDAIVVNTHVNFIDIKDIPQLTTAKKNRDMVPIIYIDNKKVHDKEMLLKCYEEGGAAEYIKKPFDSDELFARIKYHVSACKKVREYRVRIDKLANLATVDQLSKSSSKMHMQAILRHELNNFRRYGNDSITIVYLGITSIEKIISTYGLQQGEKIIAYFAKFLRNSIRSSDVLARWVSSEFVILLTNSNIQTTQSVIRKLKVLLSADEKLSKLQLELAFGLTEMKADDTHEELISRVQYAYKKAKQQTYGKVEVA